MKINKTGGGDWINPTAGMHQGVCCDVRDLGWQMRMHQGEEKGMTPRLQLVFQIAETKENEDGTETRLTARFYQSWISWHSNSNWYKNLVAWLGREAVDAIIETGEFDPDTLIGRNAMIQIDHSDPAKDKEQRVFANVVSIAPWDTKFGPPLAVLDYVRECDRPGYNPPRPSAFEDFEPDTTSNAARAAALPSNGGDQGAPANPPYVPPVPTAAQSEPASDAQVDKIEAEMERIGYSRAQVNAEVKQRFGVESYRRLTQDDAAALLGYWRPAPSCAAYIDAQAASKTAPVELPDDGTPDPFDDEPAAEPVLIQEPSSPAAAVIPERAKAKATK